MTDYLKEMIHLAASGNVQGVLFWVAVYTGTVCGYSVYQQKKTCRWKKTNGKLLRSDIEMFGANKASRSMQEYKLDALYEYNAGGKKYFGTEVSAWKILASHNLKGILKLQYKGVNKDNEGSVTVYYNPQKPEKALLVLPGWNSQLLTMLIGVTPVIYYLYRYW